MVMYNDDKTWKQHYNDWKIILKGMVYSDDIAKTQYDYRLKLITNLVKSYESSHPTS
jgi:hypothetical protein